MGPTQSPYILQLRMGPIYFWRGLTPPDPPLFRTLLMHSLMCDIIMMYKIEQYPDNMEAIRRDIYVPVGHAVDIRSVLTLTLVLQVGGG